MSWYAQNPVWRGRQILADLLVVAWVVGCLFAARLVHAAIEQLAAPAIQLKDTGHRVDGGLTDAHDRLASVPMVGDRLSSALDPLKGATAGVDQAANDFMSAVDHLALVAALLTAALPILAVVVPWLLTRTRFARRSSATRRLLAASDELDLFALRALTRQPLTTLARIDADPAAAWRRRDETVIRKLAQLELAEAGLRLPSAPRGGAGASVQDRR